MKTYQHVYAPFFLTSQTTNKWDLKTGPLHLNTD